MSIISLFRYFFALLAIISCSNSLELSHGKSGNVRYRLFKNGRCWSYQFRCQNDRCIERTNFCDGTNDCGDNSDENYCSTQRSCPKEEEFIRCGREHYSMTCVPKVWKCDGIEDCPNGQDEIDCGQIHSKQHFDSGIQPFQLFRAKHLAVNWIVSKRNSESSIQKWGVNVPRTAVAYYFSKNFQKERRKEYSPLKQNYTDDFAYELSISLLTKLALKKMEDITTAEIATYVNSFLAFCINPRKFYVVDLIEELRKRVNVNKVVNPYAILALCNAQEFINEDDIKKLRTAFQKANEEHRTDTQAIIVMALACASAQSDSSFDRKELSDYTQEIKKKQYRNGTVENIKTTALVLQALFAAEPEPDDDNFDEEKAIRQILRSQEEDGSFGGLMNTYYVLPTLSMSSLANISGEHCPKVTIVENDGLEHLKIQVGVKWNIIYSIWIGDDKILQRSLTLSVPANTSFYGVMEYAAEVDEKYKFEYNVRNRKPYIFALSGVMDDPEMETFWFPYYLMNNSTQPTLISKSPADVIPNSNEHMLFWYRKVA